MSTRYLMSKFHQAVKSDDLLQIFDILFLSLITRSLWKFHVVSLNVNLKFLGLVSNKRVEINAIPLDSIGTFGLNSARGSF